MRRPTVILCLAALAVAALVWRAAIRSPAVSTPTLAQHNGVPVWTPVTEESLAHGRFKKLSIYSPHGAPRGFVVLLSDSGGWSRSMADEAAALAARGALVVGVDTAEFNSSLEADGAECVFPDGDLENLSHFVQAYYRLPTYLSPILGGYGVGGTLAYAALAQAPASTFAGAVSVDFCPTYPSKKPLCKGSGIAFVPAGPDGGVEFLPAKQLANPWLVLPGPRPESAVAKPAAPRPKTCDAAHVRGFVASVPNARWIDLPEPEASAYAAAFDGLLAHNAPVVAAATPDALKDLPIIVVPAAPAAAPSDAFAVMLSGDGGWAGLDKDVAGALTANGVPVIGLDSLRYFWSPRTPEGLGADLDRIIKYYLAQLGKRRVLLIGYSQGADVLPFAVNRLTPQIRSHVVLAAVMGMSEHALFEFHVSSWISDDDSGPATMPEIERIGAMTVLCIYGEGESDSLCPKLDPRKVDVVKLKGGHHFDGDYAGLAKAILASSHP